MLWSRGFTIVELLVVIVIIGILATLVISTFTGIQIKTRDTVRIDDFKGFRTALETYKTFEGVYPCGDAGLTVGGDLYTQDGSGSEPFLDGIKGIGSPTANCDTSLGPVGGLNDAGFTGQWRKDPVNESGRLMYWYIASHDRESYVLYTHLEDNAELMEDDGGSCDNFYEIFAGPEKIRPMRTNYSYSFGQTCVSS